MNVPHVTSVRKGLKLLWKFVANHAFIFYWAYRTLDRKETYVFKQFIIFYSLADQEASTFNVLLHSKKGLNIFTVQYFRRRVWEMQHSGVTGWELLSHFSDVWCSSLLQLTRCSIWQRESLFRCQMWPHWMYVTNNAIKKENKTKLTWFYVILHEEELEYLNDAV